MTGEWKMKREKRERKHKPDDCQLLGGKAFLCGEKPFKGMSGAMEKNGIFFFRRPTLRCQHCDNASHREMNERKMSD